MLNFLCNYELSSSCFRWWTGNNSHLIYRENIYRVLCISFLPTNVC